MKPFDLACLQAVAHLQPDAYGGSVVEHLKTEQHGPPDGSFWWHLRGPGYGAVYTTMDTLERAGLVTHYMGEATAERGWRRKMMWELTDEGRRALADEEARCAGVLRPAWGTVG